MVTGAYPCGQPDCDYVAESPGQLGGHRTQHRTGAASEARVRRQTVNQGRESWTLRIDPELRARATRFASERVVGLNLVVETALRTYLDAHEDVSDWLDELALADRAAD